MSLGSGDETHTCRKHGCDLGDAESADSIIGRDSFGDELAGTSDAESDPRVGETEPKEAAAAQPVGDWAEREEVVGSSPALGQKLEAEHPPGWLFKIFPCSDGWRR